MGQLRSIAKRNKPGARMEEVCAAVVSINSGLLGDHQRLSSQRQITLLDKMDWDVACTELNIDMPWITRRANILLDGLELPKILGAQLKIGTCIFEITGETIPCKKMDDQFEGLCQVLKVNWRGGRTCRVINGGALQVGDNAEIFSL